MKSIKLLMIAVVFMTASAAYSQRVNRGDVCQEIPNLSTQQKSDIDKLSTQHQTKMDALRSKFYSETDAAGAKEAKMKMNAEQNSHNQAIRNLLTVEQKSWFNQTCIRYNSQGTRNGQGYVRGQGQGRGQSYYVRGQGQGRGQGYYGRRQGGGRGQGYGRGLGRL